MLRTVHPGRSPHGAYARLGLPQRLLYLSIACILWIWRALRKESNAGVVVLCYHAIMSRDRDRFIRQMQLLRGRAIAPSELNDTARPNLTGRPHVCVTFDDALANLIENALPATSELGIPVTIFVPSSNLGRPPKWPMRPGHPESSERVMTADEIRRVHKPGLVDFGSHTASHANLALLAGAELSRELTESRQALEKLLGAPICDLALPYGAFDDRVLLAAQSAGYTRVFTLEERTDGVDARGACGRFLMSPDAWPIEFRLTCAGAYGWLFRWRNFWRSRRARRGQALMTAVST